MASELGRSGTLSIGGTISYVKDVNVTMSATLIDDSTRASGGWRSRRPGLKEWGVSFALVVESTDSMFGILQSAFEDATSLSASIADANANTIAGTMYVSEFNRNEPLDDITSVDVTCVGNGQPTIT